MSEATKRAQVLSILQGMSGIGVVYDYMVDGENRSPAKFIELLTSGGIVNGWMFSRTETRSEWSDFDSKIQTHAFVIEGYHEITGGGSSEKTFQGIINAIATASDASANMNAINPAPPLQVELVGKKDIAERNYHYCKLILSVSEEV